MGLATATDLVADPVIITRTPTGNDFTVGTHTITWKADDGNGNTSTADQTITITDTTKPVIVLLGDNPQTVEFGSIYNDPGATATDAVDDNDELTTQIAAASTVDTGTVGDYTVTYTVSDKATNAATPVLRMVTVEDTTAPSITAPADITFEATDTLTPLGRTHYGTATSTDREAMITDDAPDAFPLGDTTITWTATDKSTNEMMATQVVTIVDTTKPDIAAPENITKEATGPTTPVTVGLATATDLVTDQVIITRTPEADAFAVGTHTITWKADDGNGNTSTADQTITITDTTKPVIALLGDNPQTVEFGSIYNDPGATATDAVDDNDELTTQIAAASTVNTDTVGDYTITYTVSDKATNVATPVTRMVTVTDTVAPTIIAPANMTFEATGTLTPLGRTHYGTATSTDREAMITDDAPDAFPLGATTIIWTATDPATNEMMATQVVTVVDTTKPVIALNGLPEVRVEFGGSYTELQATATDAVDDDIQLTDKIVIAGTVDTNLAGIYHITYDVTDAAGNDAITVTRTVTLGAAQIVIDKVPPTIIAPSDVVVEATSPRTTVRVGQATATDNMDPMPAITRTPTGNEFVVGKHTITWTATDASDNSNSAEQTITITDTTKPSITLTDDTADSNTVEFGSTYNDPGATATDLVDNDVELTEKIVAASTVDTGTAGTYSITYTVSDTATNAATPVLRTVTVNPAPASTDANLSSLTLSAGTLSPTFAAGTISYAVNVANDVASTTVTPTTADAGATVTVAGETVTSGEASAAIDLTVGENAIAIVVTAEDGTAMKAYTVSVTRADNTAPSIQGRAAVDYAENGAGSVATYTATDVESNAIAWTLTGTDANLLSIGATSGVLTFRSAPDYETKSTYLVSVHVTETDGDPNNLASELPVTVTVTNVDEPGAISAITGSAQVGQELTASTVTDPDGVVADSITWQWQSVDDDSDIDSATSMTYTLAVADFGKTIQVVATYTDAFDDNEKSITSAPTDTVVAADAPDAPSIALAVDTGVDPSDGITSNGQVNVTGVVTDATWKYTINGGSTFTPAIGSSFTLTQGEYAATEVQVVQTLLGTDSAAANLGAVTVDRTAPVIDLNTDGSDVTLTVGDTYTEQASVSDNLDASITLDISGETVDTQAAGTYTLTYDATDAAGNEAMQVERTVTVNPVPNTAPSIQGRAAVNYAENEPITTIVTTYTATDAESNAIAWEITGTDANLLSIGTTSGALTFNAPPNFEDAQDTDTNNEYQVTVTATDNGEPNMSSTLNVTVTVTNVDEPGAISAITGTAQVGQELTAGIVTDPDGVVADSITWQWQSADDDSDIGGATESTYTLAVADFGKPIQVVATYNDGHGDDKQVTSAPTDTVVAADAPDAPSIALAVDTGVDPSDGITSNGQVNVTGVVTDATWKYTIKGTVTEVADSSGTFFTLDEGEYAATEVQVVQTLLGTDSAAANLGAVTVDNTMPAIALNGGDTTLTLGDTYTEQATATDNVDDNVALTARITATGTVNTDTAGDYTITYDVSDAAGNAADRVTRTVIVQPILAISAGPELTSSNAGNYAKHGDTLTLTFTVNLPLTSAPTVGIAGQSVTATKGTGNSYTATYTVVAAQVAGSDGMVASYDIGAMTAAGNPANALDPDAADSTIRIDVTAPVIDLNGGDVTLTVGDTYTEQGASATDNLDASVDVVTGGATVDTQAADTYIITYTATDAAGNEATPVTRTVTVVPVPLSMDADLSSLTLSAGTLPTFAAATTSYAVNVDNDVTSVTLMPSTADAAASVTVAGTAVTSGATSGAITLTVGANPIAIVVTAEDGTTMKTYTVTVTRADNTVPSIQGRAAVDYAENGAGSVATYTATDVESNAIAWTLGGTDADQLSIDPTSGALTFRSAPDYETKSTYLVSVHVTETDGVPSNLTDELAVTVTVTNVDEDGAIDVIIGTAQVGQTLTAGTVTDPDGGVTGTTYKWQSADDDSDIGGATESTYTLAVADFGKTIQVVATYTDAFDDNEKSITSAPTDTVVAADAPDAPSIALAVDTGVDPSDGITSNGQVNVTGVVTDATWKYTINGGSTFTPAIGSSFTLTQGEYAATEVQVVQTLLGTDSAAANLGAVTVDRTAPVIDLNTDGSDVTLTVGDTYTEQASVSDNLDASITLDISGETVDTQAAGTYTLTYDATDAAGNEAMQVERTVTVNPVPNTAPSIQGRAAVNYAENEPITTIVTTYTATDAESNAIAWEITGTDANLLSIGTTSGALTFNAPPNFEDAQDTDTNNEYQVTVTATDNGEPNMSSTLNVTVTVTNVDEPGAIDVIIGTAQVGQTLTAGTVTDPDGGVTGTTWQWQSADDDSDIDSATSMTYTLAVADFGKTIQVIATYTDAFDDNEKSITSAPTDTVVAADAPDAPSIALAVDTGVDPSDGITSNGQVNVTGVVTDATWKYTIKGTVTEVADSSVTFFTLDEGEYAATEVQVVQTLLGTDSAAANLGAVTVDNTMPAIALNGGDTTLTLGDTYTEQASVTDNLDASITLDISGETVDTQAAGTYTLTYDATDAAGNEAMQVTRMVMVTDTTKPDITAPADMTFEARSVLTPLSRSDYGTATSTDDTADITDDAPPVFPLGDTTITWTATDKSTNEMIARQVVTVVDTTAPDIAAPGNIIKEATGPTTPVTLGQATATDLVADSVTITRVSGDNETNVVTGSADIALDPVNNEFAVGVHIITWKADDGNGNTITAEQTITITDTTKPVIALLGDTPQTIEFGTAYTELGATASDLVDDDAILTTQIAINAGAVDTARLGTYPVTYDVSDNEGNNADRMTRMVMVTDTAAPSITAPADITFEATDTLTPLSRSDYGTATSGDDTADITDDAPPVFPLGPTTITWRATDTSNNEMLATQVITVQDTTKPRIALLGANPQIIGFGNAYTDPGATATDAVDDNNLLTTQIAAVSTVDTGRVGDYTVIYDVTDDASNVADTVTRTITVTTAPDITAPDAMTFEARATRTPLDRSDYGTATSTDDTAMITDDAPDTFPMGPTPITWTATDTNSLSSNTEQIITIIDTTKPVITLLNDNAISNTVELGMPYRDPGATATDAVDDNNLLTTQIAAVSTVDTGTVGDYTITYDVSDDAGNPAETVTRTVTVTDIAAPGITAPAAITFEATDTLTPLDRADYGTATSTDPNADITDDAPAAFPLGDTVITWTATGINGLSSADQQMITVEDTTPPTITLLGDNPLTLEVGRHYIEPGATAVDSMAGELTGRIGIDATALDTNRVGTYTVTYTVADTTGNEAQASRSVQVLAGPDFADLNRIILSEVARSMADQNVHAVARRLEQGGGKAARSASLGGQSSLAGIITAQGQALADDQFNIKRLLADTDFVLPLGTAEGAEATAEGAPEATSRLTFWGAGDYRSISDSDQLTWDGDLFSLHLGLDTQVNASLVAGVALSWNQVALDYSNYTSTPSPGRAGRIATSGDYALEMTSIHPYVGWNLGQVDFWATLGYGEGELESTDEAAPLVRNLSSELNLQTLALGASGPLLAAGTNNLRMKVEALHTELEVAGNEQLAALSLDVSRLRMTLEATGTWSLDSGAQLGLLMEGGLRYDGGAGKTGSGTEIGSGLRYVSAANRLTLEAKARGVAHYKGGIEEWGLSGLIKYQGAADGRGLSFSLIPAYGETTSSNLQQLWQPGLGGPEYGDPGRLDYAPRIDLRLDYGMLAPGARGRLTPYGEMTWGAGSDTYRLGLRWQFDSLFDVQLVAERRERFDATEHSIILEGSIAY